MCFNVVDELMSFVAPLNFVFYMKICHKSSLKVFWAEMPSASEIVANGVFLFFFDCEVIVICLGNQR